ncbi:MAG: TetR/AcrR family transcriptional regulator [Saprospiraceae bacterium]|nr:TetR/AcrR family transcriptional regulator [Saprospiraceae bacterium]
MTSKRALPWIEEGYRMVAHKGFDGINIESIGRKINKNKSSFYHYFGDLETFKSELCNHHFIQSHKFSTGIVECELMRPDLINLFIQYKTDFFFHRQLRINRDNPSYKLSIEKAYNIIELALIDKWVDFLDLNDRKLFATSFLNLIIDNFFLRITEESFNYEWLNNYLEEIVTLLNQMINIAES